MTCAEHTLVNGWPVQLEPTKNRVWLPRCGEVPGLWMSAEMFTELTRG